MNYGTIPMQIIVLSDADKRELLEKDVQFGEKDASGNGPEHGLGIYDPSTNKSLDWGGSGKPRFFLAHRTGKDEMFTTSHGGTISLKHILGSTRQVARYPKGKVITVDGGGAVTDYAYTDPDYAYELYLKAYDNGTNTKRVAYEHKDWSASVPHVVDIVDFEHIPGNTYTVLIHLSNEWADAITGMSHQMARFSVTMTGCGRCKPGEKGDPNVVAAKLWESMSSAMDEYMHAVELIVEKDGTGTKQPGDKLKTMAEAETFIKAVENPAGLFDPRGRLKIRIIGKAHPVPRTSASVNNFKHVLDRETTMIVSLVDGFNDSGAKVVEVLKPMPERGSGLEVMQMEVGAGMYHGNPGGSRFLNFGRQSVETVSDPNKYYDIYTLEYAEPTSDWTTTRQNRRKTVIAIETGKKLGAAGPAGPKYDAEKLDKFFEDMAAII